MINLTIHYLLASSRRLRVNLRAELVANRLPISVATRLGGILSDVDRQYREYNL